MTNEREEPVEPVYVLGPVPHRGWQDHEESRWFVYVAASTPFLSLGRFDRDHRPNGNWVGARGPLIEIDPEHLFLRNVTRSALFDFLRTRLSESDAKLAYEDIRLLSPSHRAEGDWGSSLSGEERPWEVP